MTLKDEFRGLRDDYNVLTTSDLQGVVVVKAQKIAKLLNVLDRDGRDEIESVLLDYANGEMDVNSAQRFLLDIKEKGHRG